MLPMINKSVVDDLLMLSAVFNRTGDSAELQA